jgi:hypothetical protein
MKSCDGVARDVAATLEKFRTLDLCRRHRATASVSRHDDGSLRSGHGRCRARISFAGARPARAIWMGIAARKMKIARSPISRSMEKWIGVAITVVVQVLTRFNVHLVQPEPLNSVNP